MKVGDRVVCIDATINKSKKIQLIKSKVYEITGLYSRTLIEINMGGHREAWNKNRFELYKGISQQKKVYSSKLVRVTHEDK